MVCEWDLGSLPEVIRHSQMTTEQTEVILVTVYGVLFFDYRGVYIMEWYLQYEVANDYCDGDVEPIVVETFEGSNVHLKAIDNGTY